MIIFKRGYRFFWTLRLRVIIISHQVFLITRKILNGILLLRNVMRHMGKYRHKVDIKRLYEKIMKGKYQVLYQKSEGGFFRKYRTLLQRRK